MTKKIVFFSYFIHKPVILFSSFFGAFLAHFEKLSLLWHKYVPFSSLFGHFSCKSDIISSFFSIFRKNQSFFLFLPQSFVARPPQILYRAHMRSKSIFNTFFGPFFEWFSHLFSFLRFAYKIYCKNGELQSAQNPYANGSFCYFFSEFIFLRKSAKKCPFWPKLGGVFCSQAICNQFSSFWPNFTP